MKQRKKRRGFKLQTITSAILGVSVFLLSLFEYAHFSISHQSSILSDLRGESYFGSPNVVLPRIGYAQRTTLRAESLHESEIFLKGIVSPPPPDFSSHPRIVSLNEDSWEVFDITSKPHTLVERNNRTIALAGTGYQPKETEFFTRKFERPFVEDCESIVKPVVHFTCNSLHEVMMESDISVLSTKGSWRMTWKVDSEEVVLKTLNWDRDYNDEATSSNTVDAIAMDKLSASHYTVNSYGFCGQSVLTEWAPVGGREHIKSYGLGSRARLKLALDLARGLADLQMLRPLSDYSKTHRKPVFAHNDINIANIVYVNGTIKWNDFNIGVMLRTKKESKTEACGSPVRFSGDLWRSPEEIRNTSYVLVEQSDIYAFGNVLYQIMTKHQPWTHLEKERLTLEEVAERKRSGSVPTIPEQYKNSTKPEIRALYAATIACYHPDPTHRPSAFKLAKSLGTVYHRLEKKRKVSKDLIEKLFMKEKH